MNSGNVSPGVRLWQTPLPATNALNASGRRRLPPPRLARGRGLLLYKQRPAFPGTKPPSRAMNKTTKSKRCRLGNPGGAPKSQRKARPRPYAPGPSKKYTARTDTEHGSASSAATAITMPSVSCHRPSVRLCVRAANPLAIPFNAPHRPTVRVCVRASVRPSDRLSVRDITAGPSKARPSVRAKTVQRCRSAVVLTTLCPTVRVKPVCPCVRPADRDIVRPSVGPTIHPGDRQCVACPSDRRTVRPSEHMSVQHTFGS